MRYNCDYCHDKGKVTIGFVTFQCRKCGGNPKKLAKKQEKEPEEISTDPKSLSAQHRIFCDEYLLTGNKRASAIKVGVSPNVASMTAARWLKRQDVQRYLKFKTALNA